MRYSMYSPFLVALRLWSWPICRSLSHTLSSWSHMKSQTQNDLWTWFKRFQNAILFRMFHLFCASNTCHPGQSPLEWLPCGKTEYWGCPGTVAPKKAEENCDMHKTIGVRPESTAHLGCEIWFDYQQQPLQGWWPATIFQLEVLKTLRGARKLSNGCDSGHTLQGPAWTLSLLTCNERNRRG